MPTAVMLRGKQSLTLIRALVLLQVVVLRGKQSPKPERRLGQGDFCGDNMVFDELSLVEYPHTRTCIGIHKYEQTAFRHSRAFKARYQSIRTSTR